MSKTVRILLVEDNDLDAAHFAMALKRDGFDPVIGRVQTREEMAAMLRAEWDVVVSDYALPRFSAPEALETLKQSGKDFPFIVISGAVGEDTAVELMRAGASDYLLKHRLTRLSAAIERELAQASERKAKRRAEDLFRAVLRASPQPTVVVDRATGEVIDSSDAFRRKFGNPGARPLFEAMGVTHPERVAALVARGSGTIWNAVYHADGMTHVAHIRCYSFEHEGLSYAYLVLDDVTEQNYLKAAFDAVPDPLLIISSRQTLLYANRPAEEVFGQLYFGSDVAPFLSSALLEEGWWARPELRSSERRVELSGQPYDASIVSFRFAGETETSTILTLRNVSQEEELLRLATHDALTGIYNLRYFDETLTRCIATSVGGALAILDLDHFKPINDELGHAAGDAALMLFANAIRMALGPADVFARLGGDEFAIFFDDASSATRVLDAVYARLSRSPFRFGSSTARILSASIGIAPVMEGDSPDSIKKRADEALYEAKRQGRSRYVVAR